MKRDWECCILVYNMKRDWECCNLVYDMYRVASRMCFPRDRALICLQKRIFLESAVTKLYENA